MSDEMNNIPEENESELDSMALSEGDIIELINDDGETVPFIFVDALDYEGDVYLALAEPDEDDAVFFLKIDQDENGEDVYNVPDDDVADAVFAQLLRMTEDLGEE